jgi:hypothetical protein
MVMSMKTTHRIILLALVSIYVFYGCKKNDDEKLPPAINFKAGSTYTQNNDTVAIGHKLYFGIQARGTSENITNFTIKKVLENGTVVTVMDTGLNALSLDIDKIFYQNVEDKATWVFSVMDRNRLTAQTSMVINKDPNSAYGGIFYYPSIKLGYQNNTMYGHFLDPSTGIVYFDDSANTHQDKIDILSYYILDNTPSPVLSSPGEMDNGSIEAKTFYPEIINWTTRKYSLWDISVDNSPVTASAFDNTQNDSLIIIAYHDVWGRKKFKWATTGRVIPFITNGGKKGLIKVNYAETVDNGYIDIAIKIQQ